MEMTDWMNYDGVWIHVYYIDTKGRGVLLWPASGLDELDMDVEIQISLGGSKTCAGRCPSVITSSLVRS